MSDSNFADEIKEIEEKGKSVIKYLIRDFYELEKLLKIINDAHAKKEKGDLKGAKSDVGKALSKLISG